MFYFKHKFSIPFNCLLYEVEGFALFNNSPHKSAFVLNLAVNARSCTLFACLMPYRNVRLYDSSFKCSRQINQKYDITFSVLVHTLSHCFFRIERNDEGKLVNIGWIIQT